ncbi:MAG: mandelate racemase/muconate lactonizing enzyme family protein [Rubrivivax sp.]|nr:mandelate racemase/muconate lactonizing enzyme family protein [Rubrivivax sp.]
MNTRIAEVESFVVTLPRDTPYLGPLGPGETVNARGYLVRAGNRTIYPTVDRSVVIKLTAKDGTVGWGETYGLVAPDAVTAIVADVLGPCLLGRDARDAVVIQEDLRDLMRVRGFRGGFWGDAIAGVDIATWDLFGKLTGQPVVKLLGGQRHARIPAYVSGLPRATLAERVQLAREFQARGFGAFKYAAVVSHEGIAEELAALREALGAQAKLMVDLHWQFDAASAIQLIDRLAPFSPHFVEAPCAPEDLDGQARVAATVRVPVALGEEWSTVHDALPRLQRGAMAIVQPEVAHCGLSQFMQIARLAQAFHVRVIPHATVGVGIFQAASLQASAALSNMTMHEYQHSVFDRHLPLLRTTMRCESGAFTLPEGPGLGVEPAEALWAHARSAGSVS